MAQVKGNDGEMCEESKQILADKNVVFKIKRSKNSNVVIFRAVLNEKNKYALNIENPLESFWLKIEPSYVIKNRKKGKMDDRVEVSLFDRKLAFGFSTELIKNNDLSEYKDSKINNIGKQQYKVVFTALQSKELTLKMDPNDGLPKMFGTINNESCIVTELFAKSIERWGLIPTVEHVLIHGIRISDGVSVQEKFVP